MHRLCGPAEPFAQSILAGTSMLQRHARLVMECFQPHWRPGASKGSNEQPPSSAAADAAAPAPAAAAMGGGAAGGEEADIGDAARMQHALARTLELLHCMQGLMSDRGPADAAIYYQIEWAASQGAYTPALHVYTLPRLTCEGEYNVPLNTGHEFDSVWCDPRDVAGGHPLDGLDRMEWHAWRMLVAQLLAGWEHAQQVGAALLFRQLAFSMLRLAS